MIEQTEQRAATAHAEAIVRAFWYALDARDWAGTRALLHDGFVAELPLSGERYVGPEAFLRMNREYPGGWALTVIRVVAGGDRAASEVRSRRAGKAETVLSFYELKDGRIVWAADWWPEPYAMPAERAGLASSPAPIDPRLGWLDALDDARGSLLAVVEALPAAALLGSQPAGSQRLPDVIIQAAMRDEAAIARVLAPAAGGQLDEGRQELPADEAMGRLYRARADLRRTLWQSPIEAWTRAPDSTAPSESAALVDLVQGIAARELQDARALRSALDVGPK